MALTSNLTRSKNRGAVLIISMIFVVIFSALAVSMAAMSGMNVQIAENHRKADSARACAESGFDVLRFWLNRVSISGTTAPSERFNQIANSLQDELTANSITNVTTSYSSSAISIPSVTLDSADARSFFAAITPLGTNALQIDVTGVYGSTTKTIRAKYNLSERANNVFDFGVATKGPLTTKGNITIAGVNIAVESNAYIESLNSFLALTMIGNSHIAGTVKIVNPLAMTDIGANAGVGGYTGAEAMEHIEIGVPAVEFPEMVPSVFYSYATNVLTPSVDLKKDVTLTNIRIPAGMNPKFSGQATFNGVVLIESPNVVEFTGGVDITGVIVTNGNPTDDSGTNQLIFRGHVANRSVDLLPEEPQFAGLQSQMGTFIIAPGFSVSFGGTMDTLGGAIAANGVDFFGDAGGNIRGSVINYADKAMMVWGNSDLYFNRSGLTKVPAGFVPEIVLKYDPAFYSEVLL
jgi:Tfp pilus assembly protein PilX